MKRRKLVLSPDNVLQRIYTHSYYTGEARKQVGYPEKASANLQASVDDKEQMNDHMHIPINEIARMLSKYFATCNMAYESSNEDSTTANICFVIDAPQNYPDEALAPLQAMIENYTVMRTLQLWMLQQKPDEAPIAASEVQQTAFNLREMFALRKRPHIQKKNSFDKLIDL